MRLPPIVKKYSFFSRVYLGDMYSNYDEALLQTLHWRRHGTVLEVNSLKIHGYKRNDREKGKKIKSENDRDEIKRYIDI